MLFNSIDFALFVPIVFALYWLLDKAGLRAQNTFLVAASYVFYAWWDWRFLFLLTASITLDFFVSHKVADTSDAGKRKRWLWLSIGFNLSVLAFFKYFNFFVQSFVDTFSLFGMDLNISTLNIILPIGISFYTFQTMGYMIDVYRKQVKPAESLLTYMGFISFFPLLLAGPIERAKNLIPQFERRRVFEYSEAVDGMRQILWGLFKKMAVADNCAIIVNTIFGNVEQQSGATLLWGAILFGFQLYGDFSGYSDMAIGTAKLFGFKLMQNFAYPYFSRDVSEFWRRWHIALTSWLRDYVFYPIGGAFGGTLYKIRNVLILFLVSGIWHGAAWTFVLWGLLHGIMYIPFVLRQSKNTGTVAEGRFFPRISELAKMGITFLLVTFAWVFFRAENISQAFSYFKGMFSASLLSLPAFKEIPVILVIFIMLAAEWLQRQKQHALQFEGTRIPKVVRWVIYYALMFFCFMLLTNTQKFIYFQF